MKAQSALQLLDINTRFLTLLAFNSTMKRQMISQIRQACPAGFNVMLVEFSENCPILPLLPPIFLPAVSESRSKLQLFSQLLAEPS